VNERGFLGSRVQLLTRFPISRIHQSRIAEFLPSPSCRPLRDGAIWITPIIYSPSPSPGRFIALRYH